MRCTIDLGPYGMVRLLVHEHCPGGTHKATLGILRTHHGRSNRHEASAVVLSIVGEAYLLALRNSLNDALAR